MHTLITKPPTQEAAKIWCINFFQISTLIPAWNEWMLFIELHLILWLSLVFTLHTSQTQGSQSGHQKGITEVYKHRQYIIKIIIVIIIIIKHVQAWCIIITFILRGWHLLLWSILPSGPLVMIRIQMKFLLWS